MKKKNTKGWIALALIILVFTVLIGGIIALWPTKEKVAINYIRTITKLLDEYASDNAKNNQKIYPRSLDELYMAGYNDNSVVGKFFFIRVDYVPQPIDAKDNLYTGYILDINVNGYKQHITK